MKKISLILFYSILVVCLVACSKMNKTPDERKILEDYNSKITQCSYANFNTAKFVRQQYKKNDKRFIADVTLTGKDDYANYEATVTVIYNYYDDQGWMLDECENTLCTCICIKGRNADQIIEDLNTNYKIYIDDCTEISYMYHSFDETNRMDIVGVSWKTENGYLTSTYVGTIQFAYERGEWILNSINKTDSSYYLNIKNTIWKPEFYQYANNSRPNNIDLTIESVADDSTEIIFSDYQGNKYVAKICRGWANPGKWEAETFEKGYSIQYLFENGTPFYGLSIGGYKDLDKKNRTYINMQYENYPNNFLDPFYYIVK